MKGTDDHTHWPVNLNVDEFSLLERLAARRNLYQANLFVFCCFTQRRLTILSIGLTKCYRHVLVRFHFAALCNFAKV